MNETIVAGVKISISNAREILHMAGPWIGDISINGDNAIADCIVDNFVFHEKRKLLFFITNHVLNNCDYFRVNFYSLDLKQDFQFDREFDAIYLKQFINDNELEIFY